MHGYCSVALCAVCSKAVGPQLCDKASMAMLSEAMDKVAEEYSDDVSDGLQEDMNIKITRLTR